MSRHNVISTITLIAFIFCCCNLAEPDTKKNAQTAEPKGLTLTHLLDSLHIKPIRISDTDTRYVIEYENWKGDSPFHFDYPKLADGFWMLIGRAYGKPMRVVQVKNGKQHGYYIGVDEETGFVRTIDTYKEGKRNGLSISYSIVGIKDGIFSYSNDDMIDTAYLLYNNGSIRMKRIDADGIYRILEYDGNSQLVKEQLQYNDSMIICNYVNGKLVVRIKNDYKHPSRTIVEHYDSIGFVFKIDTNKRN